MELQQNTDMITEIHRRDDRICWGIINQDQDQDTDVKVRDK
jgi:hypothetical protein